MIDIILYIVVILYRCYIISWFLLNRNNHTNQSASAYFRKKQKFRLDVLRKKWYWFFNGKNNMFGRDSKSSLSSIRRSLCILHSQFTTVWLIILTDIYGRYTLSPARRTNTFDTVLTVDSEHGGAIHIQSISGWYLLAVRGRALIAWIHIRKSEAGYPRTTSKLRRRDLPMFGRLVSCHRVAAVEAAVEFRSHFTRTATWILADKNLFPRRGGLLGRRSRRKVARSLALRFVAL